MVYQKFPGKEKWDIWYCNLSFSCVIFCIMVFWEIYNNTNHFVYITFSFSRYLNLYFIRYFEYILSINGITLSEVRYMNILKCLSCCKDNVSKGICTLHSISYSFMNNLKLSNYRFIHIQAKDTKSQGWHSDDKPHFHHRQEPSNKSHNQISV